MKKIISIFVLMIVSFFVLAWWGVKMTYPVSSNKEMQDFLIIKGSSATQVANKLQKEGLIRNSLIFRGYIIFSGKAGGIPSGEYSLSPNMNMFEIIKQLEKGPIELWVTVPEGLRSEEIAQRFATTLSKDESFFNEFIQLSKGKEGMLFPDTYLFPKEATATQIVNKMVSTYKLKMEGVTNTSGLSDYEVLILASLIERETKTAGERPIVAGIVLNRLNAGWPLQIDASVQYAVSTSKCKVSLGSTCEWWPILTKDDLDINSSYNSYKFATLPPTPIASPGLSSLKAAANPESTDYWYYIHDNDGKIHFSKTLEEHNANIRKYLGK